VSRKIGRNDPCPCGSGKKYKKCCGSSTAAPKPPIRHMSFDHLPDTLKVALREQQRKQTEQVNKYGHGRPRITGDYKGNKLVAVGNQLMGSKKWKTFHDFLFWYIGHALGESWCSAEIKRPYDQRHPILQWYHQLLEFQKIHAKPGGEVHEAIATGPVMAYLGLAYDLYTLDHHTLLQKRLVHRIKDKDQFQGARYEIFVAAAFIRVGFGVTLEDESDTATSHCEFVARHKKKTETAFSVEAKSRHRPGYLGRPGNPKPLGDIKAEVYALLERALAKRADHDRIIFIDVNVPPEDGALFESDWFQRVGEQLRLLEQSQGDKPYPPAFIFFTNLPYHYVGNDCPEPGRRVLFTALNIPEFRPEASLTPEELSQRIAQKHPVVVSLYDSVTTHTQVPHSFD
jgi:hypothetical protein